MFWDVVVLRNHSVCVWHSHSSPIGFVKGGWLSDNLSS